MRISLNGSLFASFLLNYEEFFHQLSSTKKKQVNTIDYVNQINIFFSALRPQYCNPTKCPRMTCGGFLFLSNILKPNHHNILKKKKKPEFEYLWADKKSQKYKKPTQLSADIYINELFSWVEAQINGFFPLFSTIFNKSLQKTKKKKDESLFPTDPNVPFPPTFLKTAKNIFRKLFRVYGHFFVHHIDHIKELGFDAHLCTNFKHFLYFVFEFDLVEAKEFEPMTEWIVKLIGEEYRPKLKGK